MDDLRLDPATAAVVLARQCLAYGWTAIAYQNDLAHYGMDATLEQAHAVLDVVNAHDRACPESGIGDHDCIEHGPDAVREVLAPLVAPGCGHKVHRDVKRMIGRRVYVERYGYAGPGAAAELCEARP